MTKFKIVATMNIRVDSHDAIDGDVLAEFHSDFNLHQLAMMIRQGQATLLPFDATESQTHDDSPFSYDALSVAELRQLAEERSIPLGTAKTKSQILKILNASPVGV